MTHVCVSKVTIIVSDNGLSPGRRQAIIWSNAGILLIEPLGTNFSGILIEIHTFSFKKMHLKMSSGKWRPFCLGLNVLTRAGAFWKSVLGIYFQFAHWDVQTLPYTLTQRGSNKVAAIWQTIFLNEFSWMKTFEFQIQICSLGLIDNESAFNSRQNHYLNQCWPGCLTLYGVTRLRLVNSWRPSDAYASVN